VTTLVVLQPGYLPWLGYFDLLKKADVFVHYDDVQFDKHGWRNRNRVKGPKGAVWLTVPVRHSGRSGQSILNVEIDDRQDWRRKQLSTVGQLYARAPFTDTVLPQLRNIIERPWLRLVDLDLALIDWLAVEIGIATPRHRASELGLAATATIASSTFAIISARPGTSRAMPRRTISTRRNSQPPASRSSGTIMPIPAMRSSTGSSFPIYRCSISFSMRE
jgi:hypothetical protein